MHVRTRERNRARTYLAREFQRLSAGVIIGEGVAAQGDGDGEVGQVGVRPRVVDDEERLAVVGRHHPQLRRGEEREREREREREL